MADDAHTHDFGPGRRHNGHDYAIHRVIDGGKEIRVSGWGCDGRSIQPQDYLLLQNSPERSTRYQVTEIQHVMDPPDMWHATLAFAPRLQPAATHKAPQ